MKTAIRWICGLMALLMILSLLPLTAMAAKNSAKVTLVYMSNKTKLRTETIEVDDDSVKLAPDEYIKVKKQTYQLKGFSNGKKTLTIPAYDGTAKWKEKWGTINVEYEPHTHKYMFTYNRMTHDRVCSCGEVYEAEPHIDPTTVTDKVCTCGYRFSDNTELTTIWFTNVRLDQRLQKGVTEYTGTTVTYYDVKDTFITVAAFDAKAVLELPTDTTIKEGLNTFQIKVLAEDKATTATYTFNIIKPTVVEGIPLVFDGTNLTAEPKVVNRYPKDVTTISDALAAKLVETASQEGCTAVTLEVNHSQWGNQQLDTPISGALLAQLAGTKADLVVDSHFGTVTIPNAQLSQLTAEDGMLTISMVKGSSIKLYNGETEITQLPQEIILTVK